MTDPATLAKDAFAAVAARDLVALQALQHDDLTEDFVVLGPVQGRADVGAFFREFFDAFPDLQFTVERILPVDDRVAVGQWHVRGTFSGGPFQGVEPTGKPVSLRGVDVMEFQDGLLVHNTVYYDGLAFARQVGLLPAEGTRRDRAILALFNAVTRLRSKLSRD